jgi:hypothetical protein
MKTSALTIVPVILDLSLLTSWAKANKKKGYERSLNSSKASGLFAAFAPTRRRNGCTFSRALVSCQFLLSLYHKSGTQ